MKLKKTISIVIAGVMLVSVIGGCLSKSPVAEKPLTAIVNAKIFDGENLITDTTVVIKDGIILTVGGDIPEGTIIIDADGGTLMPGLIDSHVHTDMDGLRDALKFGITTELEMQGQWSAKKREKVANTSDVADLRSSGMGVTAKDGHPTQYMKDSSNFLIRWFFKFPAVGSPNEAVAFVDKQVENGADYIKIFIEDGDNIGYPGLPTLDDETLQAAVDEVHRLDKMAIVHVTSVEGTKRAVAIGVDGLGHLFFDDQPDKELVDDIAAKNIFVIPTLVTLSTAFGNDAKWLADDKRVSSKLSKEWLESLSRSMNVHPEGKLEDAYATVIALYNAGVDILAGSDVSEPIPILGGLAHGASLHHELQLLVAAGFTPTEALRAATSIPARRFALSDRGWIVPGARADLLLVDGDPLTDISDTLSIRAVWREGVPLSAQE